MEKGYIASTSGIKARDKIGYAMGDLASCLVFLLLRFVYPLSKRKIANPQTRICPSFLPFPALFS